MDDEVQLVSLPDGRQISYREQGLGKETAKRSLLVLHGLGSSRFLGMPGVSENLSEEMGVRLVAIDRPGYGQSDFNSTQSFKSAAKDVADIADALELGEKIWLLGYSCRGADCWAAARYILAIAMWAPAGNYSRKGIAEAGRNSEMWNISQWSKSLRKVLGIMPHWMFYAHVRYFVAPSMGSKWVEYLKKSLSPLNIRNLEQHSGQMLERASIVAAMQKGKGMAQHLVLILRD